ncbi:helix-turn-helix transcriptional regulator [Steroidobacter sp. S1-65]|uniref:Helix-turn-helix transcriptional regulator n=1 Tax=Steroidobacter gossypii TaxID=2805490 RepID=A0ABS1X5S0_9GAMM|nr:helix-turn-helix transcriptional regulator [Steroidobacter gossypii]
MALACGVHDQSHFTRMFAKAFGFSPGRYADCVRDQSGQVVLNLSV